MLSEYGGVWYVERWMLEAANGPVSPVRRLYVTLHTLRPWRVCRFQDIEVNRGEV